VLGVRPLLGRTINANDDRPKMPEWPSSATGCGSSGSAADPQVIGRSVQINGGRGPTEIVGVMPESFRFLFHDNDVWMPMQLDRTIDWRQRAGRFLDTVARVKPDAPSPRRRRTLTESRSGWRPRTSSTSATVSGWCRCARN
jgi:hypothetical protein